VDQSILKNIHITPLKKISVEGGDVMHGIKKTDEEFNGFGELYFSWISENSVKAWKRHNLMTMNLIVPYGSVSFVFYDEANKIFMNLKSGLNNYNRITVPPGIIFGFKGTSKNQSLVANIASIPHDPNEVDKIDCSAIKYEWEKI
tara:strand:- start:169 stop:603 length:435 start_codon:yes stop_codon:yes gene_type:complete